MTETVLPAATLQELPPAPAAGVFGVSLSG